MTVLQRAGDVGADPPDRVRGEAVALLRVEVLDGLQQAVVALLHEILEADAAAHELAGHGDDEAQVVQDELFLRALVALAGLPRDHELRLPIERGMGPDQLDQAREVVELAAIAHSLCSVLSLSFKNARRPPTIPTAPILFPTTFLLMPNAAVCC